MKKDIREIAIDQLYLDQDNARYGDDSANSTREAIKKMFEIEHMEKKIINIAEHISKNGTDPSDLPLIIPYKGDGVINDKPKYVVVEGNRRILAIMLLHRPELAPNDAIRKKIEGFTSSQIKKSLSEVYCSVLPTRASSDKWVDLKHTGENDGIGRVQWDGIATNTFRARRGKAKSVGLQIREFIEADRGFNNDLRARLNEIGITNLARFFESKRAKQALGLVEKNGLIEAHVPLEILRPAIEAIMNLMLEDFSVKDIYHDEDRKKFINRLHQSVLPTEKHHIKEGWKLSGFDVNTLTKDQKIWNSPDDANKQKEPRGKVKSVPLSANRKHLIDFPLRISNKRINDIYSELRNEIDVHGTPNAASVLFRVFLELTCDYVVESQKINRADNNKQATRDDGLSIKVAGVCKYLENEKKVTRHEAAVIRKLTNEKFGLFSVDSLNGFVHAMEQSPIPTELNKWMDNWAPLFKAIWQ